MGASESKAIFQVSWLFLVIPLLSMVIIRFSFPYSGKNQLLYLTFLLFLLNIIIGTIANTIARRKVCKEESVGSSMGKGVIGSLAPAFLGSVLGVLVPFMGVTITGNLPAASMATDTVLGVTGKNTVFTPMLTVLFFNYIGGLIGAAATVYKSCPKTEK